MASKRQEQTDRRDEVLGVVRRILRSSPDPPRPVAWVGLLLSTYRGKLFPLLLLSGTGAALFVITFFQSGGELSLWLLRLFTAGGTLFFLLAPAQNGLRVARWVQNGLITSAEVADIHYASDRYATGVAARGVGRRVVHHPALGDFRDEFSIVAPWIRSITVGTKLQVLVAPTRRETLLTVGPEDEGH
jgi:hypothetical protein